MGQMNSSFSVILSTVQTVGDLYVGNLTVGDLDVGNVTVGNLTVGDLTVGGLDVDCEARSFFLHTTCYSKVEAT
jgi:hypothetical protein